MMCKHQFEISRYEVLLSDIEGDSESDVFRYSLFRLIQASPFLFVYNDAAACVSPGRNLSSLTEALTPSSDNVSSLPVFLLLGPTKYQGEFVIRIMAV